MKKLGRTILKKFFLIEQDPQRLAYATCLGLFIGFSPFLGFQTPLIFILGYALGLPISIIFTVVYLVNNPFLTMIPIAIANYLTGYVFFTYIVPIDLCGSNPTWFGWIENKVKPMLAYFHINEVCFWYFLVGGIIFAILLSVPFYPLLKRFYTKLAHENNSAK